MSHYGTLRDYPISEAAEEIRGAKVYGLNDEKLGKIDDVIFDHSTGLIRYVVVDTGGWLKTKKFIVPADRLRASTNHKDDFEVDLCYSALNFTSQDALCLSNFVSRTMRSSTTSPWSSPPA